ncbi:hypothetical protein D6851_10805 [Altericroceibacterium spongiae]|uniref:Polyhydroxyalkanoic acid synthase n=1 Tax=Altericroceibacterium spongiae TaxID=2320269 RepID=A0A420EIX4_9SPHN|nr:polyhydroxyalkanoic acid system family protein [Altericroceibacterium spongiae]RKF20618.1 hypothetical protein D6851_10805 [Altericroceibacterium spongiae]
MQVTLPHNLGKDQLRHRLRTRSHEIADHIPGGMAQVETEWPSPDRMLMTIRFMGQILAGDIVLEDSSVLLSIDLPPALGFIEPMVESAVRKHGQDLLAAPED